MKRCKDCEQNAGYDRKLHQLAHEKGIVVHYIGYDRLFRARLWMLGGITPITQSALRNMVNIKMTEHRGQSTP